MSMRLAAEYIYRNATYRPDAIVVIQGSQNTTYGTMASQLRRVAGAIDTLSLPLGKIVIICHSELYKHLILVLALEWCGLIVLQTRPGERIDESFLRDAALVIGDMADPDCHAGYFVRVDQQWWQSIMSRPDSSALIRRGNPKDQMLLFRSSGTTGAPKRILVTRDMVQARVRQRARILGLRRTSRCLMAMPLNVAGIYYSVVACLRLGATIVLPNGPPSWRHVADTLATHTTILPFQLQRLLDALPPDAPHQPQLTVCVIGARLLDTLRDAALHRWCGAIISVYSSIEAGTIATIQSGGFGDIVADIRLRITGQEGRPTQSGSIGEICVRGPGVAEGYALQTDGSSRFSEGWFRSGDLGCLHPDGRLELFGRHDDVVNLGGIKRSCDYVEDTIRAKAGLQEVAVFTHDDRKLGQVLVVCVVAVLPVDAMRTAELCRMMSECPVSLWFLDALPRTEHGKLRRSDLRRMFQEKLSMPLKPA